MPSRAQDWYDEAVSDLNHARHAADDGDFNWACFAAQQAAEKAVKAVYQARGEEVRGHVVADMLADLETHLPAAAALLEAAKELDRHYIPARYPNAHPAGAPHRHYGEGDARRAIGHSEAILRFCHDLLAQ